MNVVSFQISYCTVLTVLLTMMWGAKTPVWRGTVSSTTYALWHCISLLLTFRPYVRRKIISFWVMVDLGKLEGSPCFSNLYYLTQGKLPQIFWSAFLRGRESGRWQHKLNAISNYEINFKTWALKFKRLNLSRDTRRTHVKGLNKMPANKSLLCKTGTFIWMRVRLIIHGHSGTLCTMYYCIESSFSDEEIKTGEVKQLARNRTASKWRNKISRPSLSDPITCSYPCTSFFFFYLGCFVFPHKF